MLRLRAPAKLNLTLHITGKRPDGYHELESLVVFTDLHDELTAMPSDTLSLAVDGPFAQTSGASQDNLVMRAARALQAATGHSGGAALTLTKHIPAGAGLGGGSSDAAATLKLLSELWGVQADLHAIAATLGADVPAFLRAPHPVIMRGIGEQLKPFTGALPTRYAVLVYPNKPLATADVYNAYRASSAVGERNDLQHAAITLMPEIAEILLALETHVPTPTLARMSGSGSCCFALYEHLHDAQKAAASLARDYPTWWVKQVALLT